MLVYKDVISGDAMFSDNYPVKEIGNIVYEVDCQIVAIKEAVDVDIGANPSAGDEDEEGDSGTVNVNNVIHGFRLQPTSLDKRMYLTALNGYVKAVKGHLQEKNPDEAEQFERDASAFAKKIVGNFKNYEFYTGESMNPDGMVALLDYREDGVTPYLTFWKHGLEETML